MLVVEGQSSYLHRNNEFIGTYRIVFLLRAWGCIIDYIYLRFIAVFIAHEF